MRAEESGQVNLYRYYYHDLVADSDDLCKFLATALIFGIVSVIDR